jgi:hypothetical protein
MAAFEPNLRLETLHAAWQAASSNASDAWLDNLSDQVGKAAQWQFPVLKWTPMTAGAVRLNSEKVGHVLASWPTQPRRRWL